MQTEPPSPQLTTELPGHESAHPPDQQTAPDWQENVPEPPVHVTVHTPPLQVTALPPPTDKVQVELAQVTVDDAKALAAAQPKARLAVLPGVNHVLKTFTGDDRGANLATYADPSLPIAPSVVDAVAGFVKP